MGWVGGGATRQSARVRGQKCGRAAQPRMRMCVFVCWATGSVLGAEASVGANTLYRDHASPRSPAARRQGAAARAECVQRRALAAVRRSLGERRRGPSNSRQCSALHTRTPPSPLSLMRACKRRRAERKSGKERGVVAAAARGARPLAQCTSLATPACSSSARRASPGRQAGSSPYDLMFRQRRRPS